MYEVTIIGGGLAGCEAAWQLVRRGFSVRLLDMKPLKFSPAHESEDLAELVCSNSLRSADPHSAVGLLKDEMRRLDSLVMKAADDTAVPAGKALAVDRQLFAHNITKTLSAHPLVTIARQEVTSLPVQGEAPTILATGPLTSEPLAQSLAEFTGSSRLFFYDAIAPILYAESLDLEIIYQKSRYDDGPGDYLNCPLSEDEYLQLVDSLNTAQYAPLHDFEEI
ncbi:MAG: methylenetetrahydrofolate--tRNA-(uracil(54)-C(5))-methyltransferase (FADH(2)-oxidizing) TrmFO, partial [Desulfofustis sp.]|nr:methylenetetrahydrofolate--tRNA-(uracil(54)-C(5))-methyltransferase (FADH(2)-oxidizing) TrmFO [Desulfofustis sp.]